MNINCAVDKSKYKKDRVILHSDCNGFYASVECLHHPEIRNKPVAVSGDAENRHGIILAKNEIAKKYNIKTGEAIWQAKQKCPDLITVPPHFDLYKRFSKMARRIYSEYTDKIEPFGLDEAWLDVTDNKNMNGKEIALEINRRIKQELGITVSIGVSFNKIFAKFGSDYKKPDAITESHGKITEILCGAVLQKTFCMLAEQRAESLNLSAFIRLEISQPQMLHCCGHILENGVT